MRCPGNKLLNSYMVLRNYQGIVNKLKSKKDGVSSENMLES